MIVLVLQVVVQEGKKEDFITIARQIAEGSQKEEGNIEYHLYEELDEPNTVAFIEKWKDQEALDVHETFEHFTKNIGKLKSLCAKPPVVNRYDIIC